MRGDDDNVGDYMPLFLGDYRRDTTDLTCLEHGAYLQLLSELWIAGGHLPFDPPRLAKRISLSPAKWDGVWARIGRFFDVFEGKVSQKRLLYELQQARRLRMARTKSGRKGADARWGNGAMKDASAISSPLANPCPKPTPTPLPKEDPESDSSELAADGQASEPPVLVFPAVGHGAKEWGMTRKFTSECQSAYPGVDVLSEAKKARLWLESNPAKRKTANGMARFLFAWLGRAQNAGRPQANGFRNPQPSTSPSSAALDVYCDHHRQAGNDSKPALRPRLTCPVCVKLAKGGRR